MGTIILKTTIITTTADKAKEIRKTVKNMMGEFGCLVSKPVNHITNGDATFMIAPDGSKLGWATHEEVSHLRKEVTQYLSNLTYYDGVIEVIEIETGETEPTINRVY